MARSAENEGFRILDDFVCDAIHESGIPRADPTKPGKSEGIGVVEELIFEGGSGSKEQDNQHLANGSTSASQKMKDVRRADLIPEDCD